MMNTIKQHKVVTITYSILNSQHAVVEQHDMPVSYLHGGKGGLLPGIENALVGHQIGDRVEILLTPEEAYGVRDESLVFVDDLEMCRFSIDLLGLKSSFRTKRVSPKPLTSHGLKTSN